MNDKKEKYPEVEPYTKKGDGILPRIYSCMFTIIGWEFGKFVSSALDIILKK